ncbi:hypothetical protein KR009_001692 [Drosophila setifemur]|nr:hypothetical protein KR009_001692 [Drosophila setifemur]
MNNLPSNIGTARGRGRGTKRNEDANRGQATPLGQSSRNEASRGQRAGGDGPEQAQVYRSQETVRSGEIEHQSSEGDPRGSVRGRRLITEVVHSRPQGLATKNGVTGSNILVQANYFKVLLGLLGGYIFDGTSLFCTKLFKAVPNRPYVLELLTKNRAGENIQIIIKHVSSVEAADNQQFQVLNLILRRAMEGLNLQLVARNYFDPQAKINMPNFRMELWPGYQTSIRQHESDILLCAEIAHKVMRTDSLYNILAEAIRDESDYQNAFKRQVIGVTFGIQYTIGAVYAQFLINSLIEIRNFLGEKYIRRVEMAPGVTVVNSTAQKDELIVEGNDIEAVSGSAALIQQSTTVKNKDIRKFLDGLYVSEKTTVVKVES